MALASNRCQWKQQLKPTFKSNSLLQDMYVTATYCMPTTTIFLVILNCMHKHTHTYTVNVSEIIENKMCLCVCVCHKHTHVTQDKNLKMLLCW